MKKPKAWAVDNTAPETTRHYRARGLTPKQEAFVNYFVNNGGNATEAARLAGYADPRTSGYMLKNSPRVASAIRRKVRSEIGTIGLRLSWSVLRNALEDEQLSADVRLKAAFHVLDYTFGPDGTRDDALNEEAAKPTSEMTVEELDRLIKEGTAWLNDRQASDDRD